jgi:VCBS repeat-containing protein
VVLSEDGDIAAFNSNATNLSPGDTDVAYDAFVKDLSTGTLVQASTSDVGTDANRSTTVGAMSDDGRLMVMYSEATNLGEGDTDAGYDAYLKELPGPAAPSATGNSYTTPAGSTLTVAAPGVLTNDSDSDAGDVLRAAVVTGPAHGTLSLASNGGFTYTPSSGYLGPDSFTYRATDGSSSSSPATVSLTVTQLNRPPAAAAGTDQTVTHNAGFTLRGGGTDADGDALSYEWSQVSGPVAVIRDPASAETAVDGVGGPATLVFRLTVTDPSGASSSDEVTITVKAK